MAEKKKTPEESLEELRAAWSALKGTVTNGKAEVREAWRESWQGKKKS